MISTYATTVITLMGIWSIVALGLNVITGNAGQFNLGIGVYMGTGAYTAAMLTTGAGFGFWEALPCAIATSALVGLVTGLPALRVREDSLAVFTIGLVFVFESLLIYLPYFGGPVGIGRIPHPMFENVAIERDGYLVIVLSALFVVIALALYLRHTWMGLAWATIRENEVAANVIGIYSPRFKLYAFTIGAGFAGLGGDLYAHFIHYVTPYDFGFLPSIYVLVMVVFGGIGTVRGAVLGACFLTLLPELFRFVQDYRNLIYGVTLIGLMLYEPRGVIGDGSYLWGQIKTMRSRFSGAFVKSQPVISLHASAAASSATPHCESPKFTAGRRQGNSLLQTQRLTQRFGGLVAVDSVSIEVFSQEIFGVIGPNGAGKTTFFNLLSGMLSCTDGEIHFKNQAIQHLPPHLIAQRGVGRTFQIVRPFTELTVIENVLAGLGARFCTGLVPSLGSFERRTFREEAREILVKTNLGEYENEIARNLPLGLLRRLEIARALGLRPEILLLDESFSGLSAREVMALLGLVTELRNSGMTVLLIEHNMQITMSICDRIAVLNHGQKIADGTPAEIRNHPDVIAAYLGSEAHA